ncbi:hypothetical protein [Ferdinandcohnia quinoae]
MCQYCTPYYSHDVNGYQAYRNPVPYDYETYDDRQFLFPIITGGLMGPPSGPPPGPPNFGPPFGQQGQDVGPPNSPPPSFVPMQSQEISTFAVDPGSIRRCLFRFTYVWLQNRQQFWFYPTFVGRSSISGYRWNGFRWLFFGIDLRRISSFTCV